MPKNIFISHSTKDDAQIDKIADALEKAGHTVWVDHRVTGIKPGDSNWDTTLRNAIADADIGVFVKSENALASEICGGECLLIRELNKPLYVLRIEVCKPENVWLYIKMIQHADLVGRFEEGIADFLDALKGKESTHDTRTPTSFKAKLTGRETMRLHLPFLNNPLRGREKDLEEIQKLLGAHVTQIIGVGGWGKSRLSAEIALAYPQGAIWHRCSPVSRSHDVLALIRQHFDLPDDVGQADVLRRLAEYKPLVVIDNAEDVPQEGEIRKQYLDLLNAIIAHDVPVLLTSRILWEEFKVIKRYPPPELEPTVAVLVVHDFAKYQDIALEDDQASQLAHAARYHPRLIEFAVGLLHTTRLEMVIGRLKNLKGDKLQDLLDDMIRRTLTQMRDESATGKRAYELLHHLTWLQGSFSLEAITALKPDSIEDVYELDDALTALQKYQFVRYDQKSGRYRLGDLVIEAIGTPQDPAVFDKYADFYSQRAKDIFVDLTDQPQAWADHEHDFPNILALGGHLMVNTQNGTQGDLARAHAFAVNTAEFVDTRREMRLWDWIQMGINATERLRLADEADTALIGDLALLYNKWGNGLYNAGKRREALTCYEKSLQFYRQSEDKKGEATALRDIGATHSQLGDKQTALDYFEQALALRQVIDDKKGIASSYNDIGEILSNFGDRYKAREYYEKALVIHTELGNIKGQASSLNNIGFILNVLGYHEEALDYHQRALPLRLKVHSKSGEGITHNNIGTALIKLGRYDEALEALEKALQIRRTIAQKLGEGLTLSNIAKVWIAQSEYDQAETYCQQALDILREVENTQRIGMALNVMAQIHLGRTHYDKALDTLQEALPLHQQVKNAWSEAEAHYLMGLVHEGLGDMDSARACMQKAVATTNDQDPQRLTYADALARLSSAG